MPRPRFPWLLLLLALLWLAPDAPAQDRAERTRLEALVRRDSLDPDAFIELAIFRIKTRQYAAAEEALRSAIRLDARSAPAQLAMSIVRDRDRDFWTRLRRTGGDSALSAELRARHAYYRRAFLLDPLVDLMILNLGDPRFGHGLPLQDGYDSAWARVDAEWSQFIAVAGSADSMPPGLLWTHGLLSAHTNRLPMAVLDFTALLRAIRILSEQYELRGLELGTNDVRNVLAAIQARAGNTGHAVTLYREIIENDLGNYVALVRLAQVHAVRQEWPEALRAMRSAITTNPEEPTLKIDLAEIQHRAGQSARAESLLIEILPDLSRNPRLFFLLGNVQWALGRRVEARETMETFLTLAPSRWTAQRAEAARILERE